MRFPKITLLVLVSLCLTAATAVGSLAFPASEGPVVTKVEPPFWWAQHSINPVRLLVRGRNLGGARVKSATSQLVISEVRINSRGTYLFCNVQIAPAVRAGNYPLQVVTAAGSTTIPFHIETALTPSANFHGINSDDVIYLIMPDRFADGDPGNNAPANSPAAANDRHNPRAYHGGDLRGVIDHLPYLKDLGVTALWLTPWTDNWNGINTCDKPWCPNTYYHGYHAIDYYGVEDHFGDLATLRELVQKAHAIGLKVIQDQVANHVGSRHPWVTDAPLENWFHGTAQNHLVEKFQNSTLLSPHANHDEFRNTLDGWFSEDLPDMNQDEPEVARYEIQNSLWWIGATGIDGVRQDTLQYMPRTFTSDLVNAQHQQYPRLWMVGEVFDFDPAHTAFFIGGHRGWDGVDTKLDSVFDFPLWDASLKVFTGKKPMRALRDLLKYDALYPDPAKLTTMLGNHDTVRFMSAPDATLSGAMLQTAFFLAVRGIPELYYGSEIAMEGGEDPDNRRDFPGGFPGDAHNAFAAAGRSAVQQRMWEWTRDWIRLRREHSAIRRGNLIDMYYDDDVYAFARQDEKETVVVVFNRAAHEKKIVLPAAAIGLREGAQLQALYGATSAVPVKTGEARLSVPGASAIAFVSK